MNTQETKQQVNGAVLMTAAIADAIRELGTVPAGVLYANLMSVVSIQQFDAIIRMLVKAELVSNVAHELKWIGPSK